MYAPARPPASTSTWWRAPVRVIAKTPNGLPSANALPPTIAKAVEVRTGASTKRRVSQARSRRHGAPGRRQQAACRASADPVDRQPRRERRELLELSLKRLAFGAGAQKRRRGCGERDEERRAHDREQDGAVLQQHDGRLRPELPRQRHRPNYAGARWTNGCSASPRRSAARKCFRTRTSTHCSRSRGLRRTRATTAGTRRCSPI